ncbi:invasion associated locus B family protein [Solemya velesiana gill symbiont]|uniref:invasion associated locus B family protein n=1 Tax=Solemya velesiana gill symbiont TaxID=1918948 RepID=UPI000997CBF2
MPTTTLAAPKPGDRFGNWVYECETKSEKAICALTQTVTLKNNQARILKLTLGRLGKENKLMLVALLPLGIHLPAGVAGKIDNANQFPLTLHTCTQNGCEAVIEVDQHLRWKMKAGKEFFLGFKANPTPPTITIKTSLDGTSAGLNAIGEGWKPTN